MLLEYKIEFLSFWHTSAGLTKGMETDNLVLKDHHDLPYLPGKTVKGLLRDAAETLLDTKTGILKSEFIEYVFGTRTKKMEGEDPDPKTTCGKCRFNDATLSEEEAPYIIENKLTPYLFRQVSSTELDENRQAKYQSLRTSEVAVPLTLYGSIDRFPEEYRQAIKYCFQMVKKAGLKRNRGWGRCNFQILNAQP